MCLLLPPSLLSLLLSCVPLRCTALLCCRPGLVCCSTYKNSTETIPWLRAVGSVCLLGLETLFLFSIFIPSHNFRSLPPLYCLSLTNNHKEKNHPQSLLVPPHSPSLGYLLSRPCSLFPPAVHCAVPGEMNPAYEPSPNMPQQIYPASIPASNGHTYQHTPYAHPSQHPQHLQAQNNSQHPHPHQLLTSSSHHSHQAPPPHQYQQVIETHPLQHHPQHQHTHVVQPPPQPVGSHHARLDSTSSVIGAQASVVTTASPAAPISRVDETTRRKYQ